MSPDSIHGPGSVPRISYAPNHEDILLDRIFGDHVGTFMGVGVRSPTADSLTYFFYRHGWRGVNLEPVPRRHAQLQAARPGDLNLALAAWDSNGEIPFYDIAAGDGLSTFSGTTAEDYRARGVPIIERKAPVRTIRSLVEELRIDPPDFLAIDAERSPEPVIRGIALEHWQPRVIVVESAGPETPHPEHHAWEPFLLAHGYLFAAFNGIHRFYLRADLRGERARLELPVSVRDRFRRSEVVALEQRVRELEQQTTRWRSDEARTHAEDERHRSLAEQQRDRWRRECEALRRELIATQRALRPYRLIDRFGVVSLGYRWARRLKPSRAS